MSRFIHWINQNTALKSDGTTKKHLGEEKLDFHKAAWHKQRSLRPPKTQTIKSSK